MFFFSLKPGAEFDILYLLAAETVICRSVSRQQFPNEHRALETRGCTTSERSSSAGGVENGVPAVRSSDRDTNIAADIDDASYHALSDLSPIQKIHTY